MALSHGLIQRVYKHSKVLSRKLPDPALSEDVAQEILLNYLEGKGKHQSADLAWIDAVRKMFGTGAASSSKHVKTNGNGLTLLKKLSGGQAPEIVFTVNVLDSLNALDKTIIVGTYWLGMTLPELAKATGKCAEHICIRRGKILRRLKNALTSRCSNPAVRVCP